MIKRKIIETVSEYDQSGNITSQTRTETDEEDNSFYESRTYFNTPEVERYNRVGAPPEVAVVKLSDSATLPTRGSVSAAGYDLYACLRSDGIEELRGQQMMIPAHATVKIGTGIAMAIPEGYFGAIFARSGLATKEGLRPANCVGVVDADYRGEIIVALHNDTEGVRYVENGERIAQLVVMPYLSVDLKEVESLDETGRGTGGFGSTGK